MKKHTRNLLIIIPLLPLLMANSPAPQREEYNDLEITYKSVETLHGYNFYHFDLKNTGEGYVDNFDVRNKQGDTPFYADSINEEICPPFYNVYIEPGFDKEIILVTKNTVPESKEIQAYSYYYFVVAEGIKFNGAMHVAYSMSRSEESSNYFVYTIQAYYDGTIEKQYDYNAAIYLTYKGEQICVKSNNVENLSFTTNERLDLSELIVDDIVMLRSTNEYRYYDSDFDIGGALQTVLVFLLVFGLLLSFGIFSAIFFPALARKRRQRALQEQDNK